MSGFLELRVSCKGMCFDLCAAADALVQYIVICGFLPVILAFLLNLKRKGLSDLLETISGNTDVMSESSFGMASGPS